MTQNDDRRQRPKIERAFGFNFAFCGDPNCGLHILAKRKNGTPICELVMSADQTLALVQICQEHLYGKATER